MESTVIVYLTFALDVGGEVGQMGSPDQPVHNHLVNMHQQVLECVIPDDSIRKLDVVLALKLIL